MNELAGKREHFDYRGQGEASFEPDGIVAFAQRLVQPLLTIAVLFFCFHLWRVGEVNVTLSDTMFILVVVIELGLGHLNGRPFRDLTPVWLASLLVMLGGLLVGSWLNGDPVRWLIVAAQYMFSYMLLPMVLIRERTMLERMVVALIIGLTAMESLGILVYYTFDHVQATETFGRDFLTGGQRLGAMVGDANWNSAVIAMALPFTMYAAIRRLIPPGAALVAAAVLCWALMLAASFTGFCAAMLSMSAMAVAAGIRPSPKILLLAGALIVGLYASGYQMPQIFAKRVALALQTGDLDSAGTYDDRADLLAEAWEHAEHTAIIGMGVDQYRKFSAHGQPVHNMYVLLLAEGGIVAVAGWIGVLLSLVFIPLSRLRRHRVEAALCLSTIMVFQVFTLASPHMYARLWMVPVFMSVGLVLTADRSPVGGRPVRRKGSTAQPRVR